MQSIHVEKASTALKNVAIPPSNKKADIKFEYNPSQDGIDHNLLILLHGLGDSKTPFAKLGQQLKLPQTATLAVQAPDMIPYMDGCYQWYPSFDMFTGDLLAPGHPERMKGLINTRKKIGGLLRHLIEDCGWKPSNIFLFGFSQGGTVALDTILFGNVRNLGGAISISGYLLEEQSKEAKVGAGYAGYIFVTQGELDETLNKALAEKKFKEIKNYCASSVELTQSFIPNKGHIMPNSEKEWRLIHSFFGKNMPRRNIELENMADVYQVNQ
ncbi:Alpha/Beta hydrolase protein [Sporodiniella umbellata]|nr:Alpha/Beta hydrolase protein [Sporodiniella umbellata]